MNAHIENTHFNSQSTVAVDRPVDADHLKAAPHAKTARRGLRRAAAHRCTPRRTPR